MTDNDSFLGPQKPPTPPVRLREFGQYLPPWIEPSVGVPMSPEDDVINTDSRMCIIWEIQHALGVLPAWEQSGPSSSTKWNSVGSETPPEPPIKRSLKNVMDAYAFVARSVVGKTFDRGHGMMFDQLMSMEPWVRTGHSKEVLPADLMERLREGRPLVDAPWHGQLSPEQREHLDIIRHQYAEILAWAQAGRDEIVSRGGVL